MKRNTVVGLIVGLVLVGVVVLSLLVFGNRSSKTATDKTANSATSMSGMDMSSSTGGAVATTAVSIDNYAFSPAKIQVKVGQTVTWTNGDSVSHNVVGDSGPGDLPNGPLLTRGNSYNFTFTKAGTYTYHCMPHPYMKGTVVVTE